MAAYASSMICCHELSLYAHKFIGNVVVTAREMQCTEIQLCAFIESNLGANQGHLRLYIH